MWRAGRGGGDVLVWGALGERWRRAGEEGMREGCRVVVDGDGRLGGEARRGGGGGPCGLRRLLRCGGCLLWFVGGRARALGGDGECDGGCVSRMGGEVISRLKENAWAFLASSVLA